MNADGVKKTGVRVDSLQLQWSCAATKNRLALPDRIIVRVTKDVGFFAGAAAGDRLMRLSAILVMQSDTAPSLSCG